MAGLIITNLAYGKSGQSCVTALFDTRIHGTTWTDWFSIYGYSGVAPAPYANHNGIDCKCYENGSPKNGAKIYSIYAGLVSEIYTNASNTYDSEDNKSDGRGIGVRVVSSVVVDGKSSAVIIDYYHLRSSSEVGYDGSPAGLKVSKGQYIEAGTLLGYQGNTGRSSGEHLHISVHLEDKLVDPYPYITGVYSGYGITSIDSDEASPILLYESKTKSSSLPYENYSFSGSESISEVASSRNTTVESIMRLNNMTSVPANATLPKGTAVKIPKIGNGGNTDNSTIYSSLSNKGSIAKDYDPIGNSTSYFRVYHGGSGSIKFYLPCTPEELNEQISSSYTSIDFMGSSSPYQIYTGTGAREVSFSLELHREMIPGDLVYIETLINWLTTALYPAYASDVVYPPYLELVIGGNLKIKGVLTSLSKRWYGPLLIINGQSVYAMCSLSLSILEVHSTPIGYTEIAQQGSCLFE